MTSATAVLEQPQSAAILVVERPEEPVQPESERVQGSREEPTFQWSTFVPPRVSTPPLGTRQRESERIQGSPQEPAFQWSSFVPPSASTLPLGTRAILEPDVTPEARSYLVGDLGFISQRVMNLCLERAAWMGVPVQKVRYFVKRSWEEDFVELVLQLYVEANIKQSLALWDTIGAVIQRWKQKLTARQKRLLNEQFAVFVEPLNF